jgi:hypothetical protein
MPSAGLLRSYIKTKFNWLTGTKGKPAPSLTRTAYVCLIVFQKAPVIATSSHHPQHNGSSFELMQKFGAALSGFSSECFALHSAL